MCAFSSDNDLKLNFSIKIALKYIWNIHVFSWFGNNAKHDQVDLNLL